ncbi:hypothetical protein BN946_scf184977.g119 [Trametes cinnabarina]|uniref:RRM domain-containing protein n=1 Tax=Pycnoporus cinnabarinus TaxID=5643 RepID=A0A060SDI0_PYCCI|nr:hypothetical protein BN946_scf184977.g119 [Trametes cinnabarina]
MLFDSETETHLKPWLVRTLEPICDAEPSALADYVLALLKHNAPEPELRKELVVQLEEFLEKESASFVDTLFTVLRTKSYLPYAATPSTSYPSSSTNADVGIPIPLDGLLNPPSSPERGRKRGMDEDYEAHGPSKGPRLNNDGQFSRYGRNDRSSWGGRGDRPDRGGRMDVNGRPDYMDGGMVGMVGDDAETRLGQKPGELPVIQDLTPQVPIQDVSPYNVGEGPRPQQRPPVEGGTPMYDVPPHMSGMNGGMATRPYPMNGRGQPRGGGRARGGTFNGEAQNFRPEKRNDKTLVVEKIPEDKLNLGAVNDWFSKFGTVTNVAVDSHTAKALVTFSSHDEAYKAWKSEEAIFGNRFVKVFWHRPMEGHGQVGQRMLAASAPVVAQRAAVQSAPGPSYAPSEGSPAPHTPTSTAPASRKPSVTSSASALAAKQRLLEQQIAEQKSLMALLSTASPQEKKDIMARLRKLNEEMKPSATSAAASQSPQRTASSPAQRAGSTPRTEEQARLEREKLDKELELHHASTNAEGEEESTEELKAKLEKLKAEAASLGITETAEQPVYPSTTYRPYRARGRGRSFYRGAMRGGPPRGSMKLDLRPKKLLVKGAPVESLQAVRDWYETTGQLESVEPTESGDVIVAFRNRSGAEQGLAKGSHIPTVGPVHISWHSDRPTTAGNAAASKSPAPAAQPSEGPKEDSTMADSSVPAPVEEADDSHMHEEIDAGGWGGEDDAFGMI